jgi:hypothetical protein
MERRFTRCSVLLKFCISFLLLMVIFSNLSHTIAQSDDVHVFIEGPNKLRENTSAEYTIEITGEPVEEGGFWRFDAKLEDEEGSSVDGRVEPEEGEIINHTFKVYVTANVTEEKKIQTIRLIINGTFSILNETNITIEIWSGEKSKKIEVYEPIPVNITAKVRNSAEMDVKDVVVSFYVEVDTDGTKDWLYIGNRTVDIPANSSQKVGIQWMASRDYIGEHVVEIRINEEGGLLELDNGDNTMQITIYVGDRPERIEASIMFFNTGIVYIIEAIGFFFLLGAFLMRRSTLRGRSYYGSRANYSMYIFGLLIILLSLPVFQVSQVNATDPDATGDSVERLIHGIVIFIFGFLTILWTWDRTRKKRR